MDSRREGGQQKPSGHVPATAPQAFKHWAGRWTPAGAFKCTPSAILVGGERLRWEVNPRRRHPLLIALTPTGH